MDCRTNVDQIFIDRSGQLKGLDCHVIYTVPISLLYSDRANDILERVCLMSGGHVRQLMQLFQGAVNEIDRLPITEKAVKRSINKLRDVYSRTVNEEQWSILATVAISKELENRNEYRELLFNRVLPNLSCKTN